MRFFSFVKSNRAGVGLMNANGVATGLYLDEVHFPGFLDELVATGGDALKSAAQVLATAQVIDLATVQFLPVLAAKTSKIICVGLNYRDHSAESGFKQPDFPTLFARFPSSLIAHGAPLLRPPESVKFDYEGEMVAVIGKGGRRIPKEKALEHVVAYSVFNDGSIRDYQHRTPQWTLGKNFDGTGAFGPYLVTADEVPAGGSGLRITTRLNGHVVQEASTDDLVFDVATLVSNLSEAMTLEPGDIIVTGTPSGVGASRTPPLFMKAGDVCEVEIEGLGLLSNPVIDEQ